MGVQQSGAGTSPTGSNGHQLGQVGGRQDLNHIPLGPSPSVRTDSFPRYGTQINAGRQFNLQQTFGIDHNGQSGRYSSWPTSGTRVYAGFLQRNVTF